MDVFSLRTFCLITGASKGFGASIAVRFAARFPKDSVLLLMARSEDGLAKTKSLIGDQSPGIKVITVSVDLAKADSSHLDRIISSTLSELSPSTVKAFEQAVIVHNAASLGDVSKLFTEQDVDEDLHEYWALNLTSFILLNNVFLKHFPKQSVKQRVVIGISSICALQPFKSWSLYCAGKAARDMLLRTMALEDTSIRVLTYAPGPIDTDMQYEARSYTADDALRNMFAGT